MSEQTYKALVIDVDNDTEQAQHTITVRELGVNDLKASQEVVGGFIEKIFAGRDYWVIANEEGAIRRLPRNIAASRLLEVLEAQVLASPLLGPVMFVGSPDGAGNSTDVPQRVIEAANTYFRIEIPTS